tara:strand:+ start:359 stop:799 length:441 start_codon:yes stop_codon:yes gene_type:complete
MSLTTRKHEPIHDRTGDNLARIKANFDNGKHLEVLDFEAEAAMIYQIQKMQDELDYLRTEIALNKAKTGITTAQSDAITANTDKASMVIGTRGTNAMAGDTKLVGIGANTTLSFGDLTQASRGGPFQITLTATNGLNSKSITLTLT